MNKIKEKKEEKPKTKAKGNKVTRSVVDVLNGNFLSKENAITHLPYLFFLTFILISYIAYGYYAEKVVKEIAQIDKKINTLKWEETNEKSKLSFRSKPSEVKRQVDRWELELDKTEPAEVIVLTKEQVAAYNEE
jgi:hypothetical protein